MSGEAAGMMSGLFFVGKGELLRWLNDFFKINYTKVEEVASGAIHCQILDSIFPGRVALHKVNFNARYDYEFVANYKVLQDVFAKEGLKKQVDVAKLVQAKFQDNLEFLQWMKHLWDTRYTGEEYDAVARRDEAMAIYAKEHKFSATKVAKPTTTAPPATKKPAAPTRPAAVSSMPTAKPVSAKPAATAAPSRPAAAPAHKPAAPAPAHKPAASHADEAAAAHNAEEIAELNGTISKLKVTIEGLEKERNFYFGKLREIEILCQTDETKDNETKQKVLEILYATDGAEDFEAPQAQEEPQEQSEVLQDDAQQNYEENDGVIDNDGNY